MDVDQLLRSTDLPEVAVGTEDALATTVRRGRAARQRRAAVLGACTVVVAVVIVTGGLTLAGGDDPARVSTGATGSTEAPGSTASTGTTAPTGLTPPADAEPGDAAVWSVGADEPPSSTATTVTAMVRRLGCNDGETGRVLRPGVVVSETAVVVTFNVENVDDDAGTGVATCLDNALVPYQVDLGQPLGERVLVDAACAPGGAAADTPNCSEDAGIRWRPDDQLGPRPCEAGEGEVTEVATEPDWRQYVDLVPWTDRDGCFLRVDVLMEQRGVDHCGFETATVLSTGRPLGTRFSGPGDDTEYIRDPAGVVGDPALAAGFDTDASLPGTAVDSGFRRGLTELWHDPADPSAVWLVGPDHTERWPAGEMPLCE